MKRDVMAYDKRLLMPLPYFRSDIDEQPTNYKLATRTLAITWSIAAQPQRSPLALPRADVLSSVSAADARLASFCSCPKIALPCNPPESTRISTPPLQPPSWSPKIFKPID